MDVHIWELQSFQCIPVASWAGADKSTQLSRFSTLVLWHAIMVFRYRYSQVQREIQIQILYTLLNSCRQLINAFKFFTQVENFSFIFRIIYDLKKRHMRVRQRGGAERGIYTVHLTLNLTFSFLLVLCTFRYQQLQNALTSFRFRVFGFRGSALDTVNNCLNKIEGGRGARS